MSKSLWINIIRLIKSTKGRFISLTSIVAIGVAFFVGVSASSPIMGYTVDEYNDELSLKDFTIYSNYGFDEDDIDNLKSINGIDKVEGAWFADVLASSDNTTLVTRIHSFNSEDAINKFVLKDGRLPKNKNEALAESGTELIQGFPIGSKVTLDFPNNTKNESLLIDEVEIVGTIDTPLYLNETKENSTLSNQYLDTYLYVLEEAFDNEFYLEVNLLSNKAKDMYSFSEDYEDYTDNLKDELKEYAKDHENDRVNKIRDEALEEYEKGLKEYEDAEKEFNEKIDEASEEIKEGEEEISKGEEELAKAEKELQESQESLNKEEQAALAEINDNKKKIEEAKSTLEKEKTAFEEKKIELNNTKKELNENLITINEGINQINNVKNIINKHISNQIITNDTNVAAFIYDIEVIKKACEELNIPLNSSINVLNTTIDNTINSLNELATVIANLNQDEKISESMALEAIKAQYKDIDTQIRASLNNDSTVKEYNESLNNIIKGFETFKASSSKYPNKDINSLVNASNELQNVLSNSSGNSDTSITFGNIITNLDIQLNELNNNINQINEGILEIDNGIKEGETKISEAENEIATNEKKINDAIIELNKKIQEAQLMIDNGAGTIAQNRYDLLSAYSELEKAKKELNDAKVTGQNELDDAKKELDEAKKKIDDIEDNEWTVLNRNEHYASVTYNNTVKQMHAIGNIFPVFFILVAALVCLTTMKRMVDEERGEIGVLRALGYSRLQCAMKYLIYAFIATILGSIIGASLGIISFPVIIYNTWRMMYILPKIHIIIPYDLIIISVLSFLFGMLLTTWFACRGDMKEVPSQLMRPKAPKLGKSIFLEKISFIWDKLSFTWKVTMRNIFRYRRRFIMTVIGVAGCTALLVTGFGIRDSINSIVDLQFYDIYKYDGTITLEKNLPEGSINNFMEELTNRDEVSEVVVCGSYSALAKKDNTLDETVTVEIFKDNDTLEKMYHLRNRLTKEKITLNDEGIIISEKLSENLGLKVGDTLRIEAENGTVSDIPISAICEMYVNHRAFISERCYEEYFNSKCRAKSILVKYSEDIKDEDAFHSYVVDNDDVDSIDFFDAILENFNNMVSGLNMIVWTLIISSMSLAFVVLGNLINVNISERQREIATIKVLGFRRKEVSDYIYKENNVLVFLGALVGLPVGNYLHHYIMRMVEMDYIMFGRNIKPISFVQAVILTIIFGLLVNILMAKKIRDVKMVESLKSVE